ncbi:MAG: thiol:disulfide interchange protein [Saprospiraceae bacterium]|jgi:thiol:disulfide interchange protein
MKRLSLMLIMTVLLSAVSCIGGKTGNTGNTGNTEVKEGIKFIEGETHEAVLAKAQIEGKPIVIDFYTTWCAPCKWLEKDVFQLESVADYYNENFINYKVNAEDFDGVSLAQQYEVGAYPTLIFLKQDGTLLRKHEGTTTASNFMKWGKSAVIKNKDVQ